MKNRFNIYQEVEGKSSNLYSLVEDGRSLLRSFMNGLEEKDRKQLAAMIRQTINSSKIFNKQKFRHIEGNVFEIKTRNGIRVTVLKVRITEKKSLVVLTGFHKGPKKQQTKELEKAKRIGKLFDVNNVTIIDKIKEE